MNRWEMVRLGDVNQYKSKPVNPMKNPDQIFELYSVPCFDNDYPEIILGSEIGSIKQTVQKNDVLLCKINPRINRVWIVSQYTEYPMIASSEWIVFRNPKVNPRYLLWFLRSNKFRNILCTNVTGIGGSLTRVQPKQVFQYEAPLPPLEVQKKIAQTLDAASELIALRKKQLAELDNLIKAIFYDMFGDPVVNEKGWKIVFLREVCNKITDGTHNSPENLAIGDYMYITAKNIKSYGIDIRDITYVSKEVHNEIYNRCNPEPGDILYIKDGVTTGIAQINTIKSEFSMLSSVALLKHNRNIINNFYMREVLNNENMYKSIRRNMGGAAITRLTLVKISNIKIPLPPLFLQTQFSEIVTKIEEQKALVQKAIDESQHLFDSLMSQYF